MSVLFPGIWVNMIMHYASLASSNLGWTQVVLVGVVKVEIVISLATSPNTVRKKKFSKIMSFLCI